MQSPIFGCGLSNGGRELLGRSTNKKVLAALMITNYMNQQWDAAINNCNPRLHQHR